MQLCTEAWREHLPVGQKAAQGQDFRACREAQEPQRAEELPQSGEMGAQLLAGGGGSTLHCMLARVGMYSPLKKQLFVVFTDFFVYLSSYLPGMV